MKTPTKAAIVTKQNAAQDENGDDSEDGKDVHLVTEADTPANLFEGIDDGVLMSLQSFIDEHGLGSEKGSKHIAQLDPEGPEFAALIARLQKDTGMSPADAKAQLLDWQSRQKDLDAMIQEQKQKQKRWERGRFGGAVCAAGLISRGLHAMSLLSSWDTRRFH